MIMCPHLIQGKPVVLESPSNAENSLLGVEALLCAVMLLSCDFLARAEQVVLLLCAPAHWMFPLALPFGNAAFICWSRNCTGTRALEGRTRTVENGRRLGWPIVQVYWQKNMIVQCTVVCFVGKYMESFNNHWVQVWCLTNRAETFLTNVNKYSYALFFNVYVLNIIKLS